MTTPRFLILPDLIVKLDAIMSIHPSTEDDDESCVYVFMQSPDDTLTTKATMPEVTAALREAMKGPDKWVGVDLASGTDRTVETRIDIAQQARETREAGKPS